MSHSQMQEDLSYLKSLAESGAHAPNIGGRFYVWWSVVTIIALMLHAAIGYGLFLDAQALSVVWIAALSIGTLGSFIIGKGLTDKPGVGSAGNLASSAYWSAAGPAILVVFASIFIAVLTSRADNTLFNMIPAFAFFAYGAAYAVEGKLEGVKWKKIASLGGFVSMAAIIILFGDPISYLVAAAAHLGVGLIPGIIMMRNEPSATI